MQNTSLLSESFYADPWTPDTPSEDGTYLWQSKLENESGKKFNNKFDNNFTSQNKPFPVHLKPCPEVPPPLDLDKGLKRMENKLKRIQGGKTPNKLSSRDILTRLNSSRDDIPISNNITAEPTILIATSNPSSQPTLYSSVSCCCCYRHTTDSVVARYTSEVGVTDTIPLVLGDELVEND